MEEREEGCWVVLAGDGVVGGGVMMGWGIGWLLEVCVWADGICAEVLGGCGMGWLTKGEWERRAVGADLWVAVPSDDTAELNGTVVLGSTVELNGMVEFVGCGVAIANEGGLEIARMEGLGWEL